MPENKQQPSDEHTRQALIQAYSQAAARAHDAGNEAAAHGLTVAATKLIAESEKK